MHICIILHLVESRHVTHRVDDFDGAGVERAQHVGAELGDAVVALGAARLK